MDFFVWFCVIAFARTLLVYTSYSIGVSDSRSRTDLHYDLFYEQASERYDWLPVADWTHITHSLSAHRLIWRMTIDCTLHPYTALHTLAEISAVGWAHIFLRMLGISDDSNSSFPHPISLTAPTALAPYAWNFSIQQIVSDNVSDFSRLDIFNR